ncbi:trafficking protein particle complex subunit 8 homolog l(3)76BDm [Arctopsyche grandis]|uniref:trafficking protein particle complex subunit 8 homolog l(3)76BDm n=1 Tax=Arctopsyche grandis TaxID=121162 RepID=UPI00406D877F
MQGGAGLGSGSGSGSGATPQPHPHELVSLSFGPAVAALPSPSADLLAQKNNLTFVELLQPFCRLSSEGHIRDPSGQQYSVKNLKLNISNVNTRPPQPTLARKFLNESVSNTYNDKTVSIQIGRFHLDIPAATPWFEAWRETFFNVQFPSDHEFTKHFVACLLVVTTTEADPIETMKHMGQQLSQMQNVTPPKLPKWFNTNVLRCYVLLHDALEGNIEKAKRYFESLKQTYGAGNCFFMSINSRNPNDGDNTVLPDPWSKFLIRRFENNDSGSDKESMPRTPADISVVSSMPVNIGLENKQDLSAGPAEISNVMCESATEASESGVVTVQVHPLSPSEDIESSIAFDSANSLQSDVMSNSMESDTGVINPNVWENTSGNAGIGVVHGACLSTQDIENIRVFVQDFAFKALLPYFERQIFQLQDAVSNKKGVSRSLFIATKRWFGTNKPGTNMPVNSVIYTGDCPELQLRRLGDIWFMLGQWSLAFQVYHTAKREYFSDNAWLCYAGALEMAALSAFMGNESSRKTFDYMEESIMRYSNSCRMPQYAVRATLLSVLCLNNRGLHGEAAKQLIRMTSEDCDLRSAVLLEHAALCFLAGPTRKTLPRKYAFHMVLAGHRYSKAGQRKHSLRCYKQAYQVYQGGGWRLATDHIEFAVGRLAGQVRAWDASSAALSSLLAPRSLQPPAQQAAFLREYLHIVQQWLSQEPEQSSLPQLPVPLLDSNMTAVLCGGLTPALTPGKLIASGTPLAAVPTIDKLWASLEEMMIHKAKGAPVMIFKPTISLFCKISDNSTNPIAPQGEPVQVLVHLLNPLQIDISIIDVQLLWQFKTQTLLNSDAKSQNDMFYNENCILTDTEYDKSVVTTQKVPLILLQSDKITPITMNLTPLHPGELTLLGVSFKLCNPIPPGEDATPNGITVLGKQIFEIKGPKLKGVKDGSAESQYGIDNRLNIVVVPPSPCLQVTFSEICDQLLCGELQRMSVEFKNIGRVGLKNLFVGLSHPQYLSLSVDNSVKPFAALIESKYTKPLVIQDERQLLLEKEKRIRNRHCLKVLDSLGAGQTYSTVLWLRAPEQTGNHKLHALFYYENMHANALPKHRLLRHTWNITLKDSVQVSALARRNLRPDSDNSIYRESLNMAIEVKNVNQVHHGILTSLEVQQVSLLSQNWTLDNFVPINDDVKSLSSQETLHIITRAKRTLTKCGENEVLHSDIKINSDDNLVSIKDKPYSNFVTNYSSAFGVSGLSDIGFENVMDIDEECLNSVLVVRWKADITESGGSQRVAIGQHHIGLDKLSMKVTSHNVEASKSAENPPVKLFGSDNISNTTGNLMNSNFSPLDERLITFTLEHQFEVVHDFKKLHVCLVPVKLHLVNCSTKDVIVVVNTGLKSFVNKCPGVGWVGIGGNDSGGVQISLSSLKSNIIPLQIACTSPGTYSLGNIIRVSCKVHRGEILSTPILQDHVASSTLIVMQNT